MDVQKRKEYQAGLSSKILRVLESFRIPALYKKIESYIMLFA
jgi:hypothetical protein